MAKSIAILFLLFFTTVHSASLFERSYEYVLNFGKNLAPSFMSILDCFAEKEAWLCAKEKAGRILDNWEQEVDKQRRSWQDAADAEVASSGRSIEEMPSKIGREVESSLFTIADLLQSSMARSLAKKHDSGGGGIDSITISTGSDKKKMKKKKQKPPRIHLVQPSMMPMEKGRGFKSDASDVQSWVIGKNENDNFKSDDVKVPGARKGRGILTDVWNLGEKALDAVAEHAIESDNSENGIADKSSFEEQRGKKKKKKKAILKLLILGAVLKAKIGTLLQILSFKLQVKFFIIALIGLAINLARFWVELKHKHQQPQKVIYYEHAQHQHHYDHEEEPGWGPWSRSMEPEDAEADEHVELSNGPYRAQERTQPYSPVRPLLTLS
ncbi:uncharacterized protein [Epargyreus clarus]|uniref:uncharacterized protein isoform X1 n=1 Tax=Epargyreus clarus TaxID=520877 RepID=UPI003C2F99FA